MGAGIEIGECEGVVLEGVALKIHGRGLMSNSMVLDREAGLRRNRETGKQKNESDCGARGVLVVAVLR
jgi:hypothetical protein